jgi:biotin transporter BioY
MTLTLETILAKLPIGKLSETIEMHIRPLARLLPDKRLGAVVQCIILGILGGQTPVITEFEGGWRNLAGCEAHISVYMQ